MIAVAEEFWMNVQEGLVVPGQFNLGNNLDMA